MTHNVTDQITREHLVDREEMLWEEVFANAKYEAEGFATEDRGLNAAFLEARSELSIIDGNIQEAQRLERWSRGIKGERE